MPKQLEVDYAFAQWLEGQLRARDLGVRTLARMIDPERVNSVRTQLQKYLRAEVWPEDESRQRIAVALGVPVATLPRRVDDVD